MAENWKFVTKWTNQVFPMWSSLGTCIFRVDNVGYTLLSRLLDLFLLLDVTDNLS